MDNNVTGENHITTYRYLCNWIENGGNPVVSGNATFYCQPSDYLHTNMLRSLKLVVRWLKGNV